MTIVNKVSFTNVSGGVDILDKIRTTAVSWGWTQAEWLDGVVFSAASNAWVADVNGGYLALTSPGQGGSQDLIAKLQFDKWSKDQNQYMMMVSMCNSTAYSLSSADFPAAQNMVTTTTPVLRRNLYGWSLPTTNIPEIWIIGNSQYIWVCANIDGVYHPMMEFGSYEMREAAPLAQSGSIVSTTRVGGSSWYAYKGYSPQGVAEIQDVPSVSKATYSDPSYPYWEGQTISAFYRSVNHIAGLGSSNYLCFTDNYSKLLTTGDNSGRRLMMRSTILYTRPSDGLVVPVSETYASIFNGLGLQPGQSLFYGTDEYIVFPCCSILSTVWVAFRIA